MSGSLLRRGSVVGMVAVSAIGLVGCATQAPVDFWDALSVHAQEVDPPESLDEPVDDSPTIVQGRITAVIDVPPAVSGVPAADPVAGLVVEVTEQLAGSPVGATITVVRPREPAVPLSRVGASVPRGELIFFLEPAGYGDYFGTTSDLGVIGEVGGRPTTVTDPARGQEILPVGLSLAQLADAVER